MTEASDLLQDLKAATKMSSAPWMIDENPAFIKLVGLGDQALPDLETDLKAEPSPHAMMVLKRITGAMPYPPSAAGNIDRMAAGWIKWLDSKIEREWDEGEHPRDEDGRFSDAGGGSDSSSSPSQSPSGSKPTFESSHLRKGDGVSSGFHQKVVQAMNRMGPQKFLSAVKKMHVRYEVEMTSPSSGGLAQYRSPGMSEEGGWPRITLYEDMMRHMSDDDVVNVIAHEVGHAIDQTKDISNGIKFVSAKEKDQGFQTPDQAKRFSYYRGKGRDWQHMHGETFAEAVAAIVGPKTRLTDAFREAFPRTVAIVEKRLKARGMID